MKIIWSAIAAIGLAQIATATEVNVTFSEDFQTELADEYGEREGTILAEKIERDLLAAFDRKGVTPARVDVMIVNAKPNRPTRQQLVDNPGLDGFRSISLGGMDLEGTVYAADNSVLSTQSYDHFENDIRDVLGSAVWTDARRASKRFSERVANDLAD